VTLLESAVADRSALAINGDGLPTNSTSALDEINALTLPQAQALARRLNDHNDLGRRRLVLASRTPIQKDVLNAEAELRSELRDRCLIALGPAQPGPDDNTDDEEADVHPQRISRYAK